MPLFDYLHHASLLSVEAAEALAWTVVAQHPYRNIECRLVRYKMVHSWTCEKIGIVAGLRARTRVHDDTPIETEADTANEKLSDPHP